MVLSAGSTSAVEFLQDGNGYWWDFQANGAIRDGSAGADDAVDSFDNAMRLAVDGVTFPEAAQRYEMAGRMLITGPVTLSGLNVTRRAYVPNTAGAGWACFLEYLENPGAFPVTVDLRIFGNLGSDGNTRVTASSSGDAVFTPGDRWVASDDANDGFGDPSLNFNYWGSGAAIVPSAVFWPASQENYYVDFPGVTIPATSTVVLMHFCGQNANDAAAAANAANLDGLPAAALAALNANRAPVLNWVIAADALSVSWSDTFVSSGQQGGPFSPDTRQYMLTNNGGASLAWSAAGPAWLTINPSSGAGLGSGASVPVDVSINAAADGLSPGTYLDAVTFTHSGTGVSFKRYAQLVVNERLVIDEAGGFSTEGFQGGPFDPANATYTLRNTGTPESLAWSITGPAWVTIAPADSAAAGGPLAPDDSVQVTVTPNAAAQALAPGAYNDMLTFSNDTFGGTQARGVSITINERLAITPDRVFISRGLQGGPFAPIDVTYTLTNLSGDQAVSWSIAGGSIPAWLSIAPATGGSLGPNASYEVTVQVNANADVMATGDYAAALSFQNDSYGTAQTRDTYLRIKDVVYVDSSVSGGDGNSWATALASIQAGINAADATDSWVWVAEGEYVENITMAGGVELYGGFAGGEATLAARDPAANVAVINGNDAGRVVSFGAIQFAGLDGFTIINGLADTTGGGGIRCDGCDATTFIKNCAIRNNRAQYRGGGIYCLNDAAPEIADCIIAGNELIDAPEREFGGGICCVQASPTITDSWICDNGGRYGAGLGCIQASPVITNCILSGNVASNATINPANGQPNGSGGGGVFAHNQSHPVLTNCIISGNYTQNWGAGALYCQEHSVPLLTNCTITSNRSYHTLGYEIQSGIVVNTGSAPILTNCILEGMTNIAVFEEDAYPDVPENLSNVFVRHCLFANNRVADFREDMAVGGGAYYTGGDNINAHVNGADNNVYGNPAPQFAASVTGTWSAPPAYDDATNLTTLTASGSPFASLDLKGRLINADVAQTRHALILANSANTVSVAGDVRSGSPFGYADAGDAFAVLDFHLNGNSPGINVGDNDAVEVNGLDLDHGPRVLDGIVDLGAYECGAPTVATVVSVAHVGGPVAGSETVQFEIIFSRGVTGLDISDFILTGFDGQSDAAIFSVSGEDYRWIISIATGGANGALHLDFVDDDGSVVDILGFSPIANFTAGTGVYIDFLGITTQPQGGKREPGESFTFFVEAQYGTGQLHYTWKKDGLAAPGAEDSPILAYTGLTIDHSGTYTCEVSDDYTTVISNGAELIVAVDMPAGGVVGLILLGAFLAAGSLIISKRR